MTGETQEVTELPAWGQTRQQGKPLQTEGLALRWLTLEGDTVALSINHGLLPPDDHPDVGRTDHMFLQRHLCRGDKSSLCPSMHSARLLVILLNQTGTALLVRRILVATGVNKVVTP